MSLDGVEAIVRADVCIVGAGAAGLALAYALRLAPLRVLILESGPVADPESLNAGEPVGHEYNGLLQGRVRGVGGTTAVWPGQCMRLRPSDLAAWPFDLERHYRRAEELLGIPPGETAADPWLLRRQAGPGFDETRIESATAVFCRVRRLAEIDIGQPTVLEGAIATRIEDGRVEARDLAGRNIEVEAGAVVLAAGTIETLRLMLVSGIGGERVGWTFEDHACAEPARVLGPARPLQDMYGMRSRGGLRYYPKLLLASGLRDEHTPGCMANVVFRYGDRSPLQAALRLRRAYRARTRPSLRDALDVARGVPELALGGLRLARGLEPAPTPAEMRVLTIVEQLPTTSGRLSLSHEVDTLGVPRARIDWRLGEAERRSMETFVHVLDEEFRRTGAGALEVEPWLAGGDWEDHAFDVFHPAGGARIGDVVDEDCRVCDTDSVYVCSAAAFPRSGCANPTLTIIALAFRLADHLQDR
jgi:choline dehydrogenase-like flavoprotein